VLVVSSITYDLLKVFSLITCQRNTLREAAEHLGWTPRAVQCRLKKARALLRIKLKDYEPPDRPDGGGASARPARQSEQSGPGRRRRSRQGPGTGTTSYYRCRRQLKSANKFVIDKHQASNFEKLDNKQASIVLPEKAKSFSRKASSSRNVSPSHWVEFSVGERSLFRSANKAKKATEKRKGEHYLRRWKVRLR
jgi:hypothetical protein